jgi:hypothetical protein
MAVWSTYPPSMAQQQSRRIGEGKKLTRLTMKELPYLPNFWELAVQQVNSC